MFRKTGAMDFLEVVRVHINVYDMPIGTQS